MIVKFMPFHDIYNMLRHLTREMEDVMFRRAGKVMSKRDLKQFFDRVRPPCNFNCLGKCKCKMLYLR